MKESTEEAQAAVPKLEAELLKVNEQLEKENGKQEKIFDEVGFDPYSLRRFAGCD